MDTAGSGVMLVAVLVLGFFVFLLCRAVVLWYWKIDEHISNQKRIIADNDRIVELLEKIESNTRPDGMLPSGPPVRSTPHTTPLTRR